MNPFDILEQRLAQAGLTLCANEPMSRHTSFRIGGPVRLLAVPHSEEELIFALRTARELDITPFPLGNGTNLLCSDEPMQPSD